MLTSVIFGRHVICLLCFANVSTVYTDFVDSNANVTNSQSVDNIASTTEPSQITRLSPSSTSTTMSTISQIVSSLEPKEDANATPKSCMCSCQKLWTFLATPEPEVAKLTIEEKVDIIVAELTVDKKNTTASQRRLISVMDDRPTSVGIGAVAAGIIFSIFGVIVIIDISRIWIQIIRVLHRIKLILKGFKIEHKDPVATLAESTSRFNVTFAAPGYDKRDNPDKNKSTTHKTETMNLDTIFSCKSVPKGKLMPPRDTKIPTIVVEMDGGFSRKMVTERHNKEMDDPKKTMLSHLTIHDLTDDGGDDLHMDMIQSKLDVPKQVELHEEGETEMDKQETNHVAFKETIQDQLHDDEKELDRRGRENKPPTSESSGTRPRLHKRQVFQPKPAWRYWK